MLEVGDGDELIEGLGLVLGLGETDGDGDTDGLVLGEGVAAITAMTTGSSRRLPS